MKIEVTEDHIALGLVGSCAQCPVALAVKSILREGYGARVTVKMISIIRGAQCHTQYEVPKNVSDFIARFDLRGSGDRLPKPFSFDLELSQQVLL